MWSMWMWSRRMWSRMSSMGLHKYHETHGSLALLKLAWCALCAQPAFACFPIPLILLHENSTVTIIKGITSLCTFLLWESRDSVMISCQILAPKSMVRVRVHVNLIVVEMLWQFDEQWDVSTLVEVRLVILTTLSKVTGPCLKCSTITACLRFAIFLTLLWRGVVRCT